jgi:hypothetical protein
MNRAGVMVALLARAKYRAVLRAQSLQRESSR